MKISYIFWLIFLFSCNPKMVYVYQDSRGVSKFELYRNGNYRYTEKTKREQFSFFATYEQKNDSIVAFEYPDKDKLPFCFFDNSLILLGKSSKSGIKIQIKDRNTKENLALATVILLDENYHFIAGKSSDFNGKVEVSNQFSYLELQATGYPKYRFSKAQINGHDFICEVESLKPGYCVSKGCYIVFQGCYLDYEFIKDENGEYLIRDSTKYLKFEK